MNINTNMLVRNIVMVFFIATFLSCVNDDDTSSQPTELTLATGISLRETVDSAPLVFGNPNSKTGTPFMAPNPAVDVFNISSFNTGKISKIWIIKADIQNTFQDVDFVEILQDVNYEESSLTAAATVTNLGVDATNLTVNVEDLEPGYYRVFVKVEGVLNWDNLYISNGTNGSLEEIASPWQ